jgi:hypothetical protein
MHTLENLFHFLRQLAAIVWLGGVLALNVLQLQVGRGQDRAALGPLLRRTPSLQAPEWSGPSSWSRAASLVRVTMHGIEVNGNG